MRTRARLTQHGPCVICCFTFPLREMHTSLHPSRTSGQIQSGLVSRAGHIKSDMLGLSNLSVISLPSFCSQFFCHSSQRSPIANSMKPAHHFTQHTNPYHHTRSCLIGSPLNCLSSAPLHKGAIIHHTPNLLCHFSFKWKIRGQGAY